MNHYFHLQAKRKKDKTIIVDKYKRLLTNYNKPLKMLFDTMYSQSKMKNINKKESTNSFTLYKSINNVLEINIQLQSVILSPKFENLYFNVFFANKKNEVSEDKIREDVFSFWYLLKNLKKILIEFKNNSESDESLEIRNDLNFVFIKTRTKLFMIEQKKLNEIKENKDNIDINFINKNLSNYLNALYLKKKNSLKNTNNEINESEVFDKEFYKIFDFIVKYYKVNLLKIIMDKCKRISNEGSLTKFDLLYIKNCYGVLANDAQFSFQITEKLRRQKR